MAKTILICNQKGGVGKSTLADILLWAFEKDNVPVTFYDLDKQGGVIHEEHVDPNAEVVVVDTPGALQKDLVKWIQNADLVIVPTKTTMMDMNPLLYMIDVVRSAPCPVIYVEAMFNRFTAAAQFDEWLSQETNGAKILKIPQSELVVQAAMHGKSVIDYAPKSSVAQSASEFVKYVRSVLNV